ncbi:MULTISPECIES: cell division protein FtsZ [Cronobacter]|uniref:Cell division protein FtsZ n=1 Tax=Cronobacter malonaticus TaxID=413503 RepID=A0A423XU25_9ENTR|nr:MULTISPECIES: cell division protein FtsZ [Cronobacter]KAB0897672.1 cell division protein FtsZ [Cronobacter sakazakii]KAB0964827.1 cell division protein FtsZ [Cronobacter sakazakii]KAB0981272.1 cell division protein FtsZ [Cronobacter sakazakii]KAB0997120.1 cell division protein FtsZ [Cronobacter sakazakii]KAB0999229.1 cell division protein FtsZ [Cronobacter sakazakii]
MVNQHYGTMPVIRQCLEPGMMALRDGCAYRVSAIRGKHVYLHSMREQIRITDRVVEVFLDGFGNPLTH